ncbi:MAG: AAA family ATPase [Chloroflexota bacterium]
MAPTRRPIATPAPANDPFGRGFIRTVSLRRELIPPEAGYPFDIPAVRTLQTLELHPSVTYFIGENGSGKSTLLEAIAVAAGFNAEGGSRSFRFQTRSTESSLHEALRLTRSIRRQRDGFFLRAESLYNVATEIEELNKPELGPGNLFESYGGDSLHAQSHGESFIALASHRFRGEGLYLLDEPEAALSPSRQLAFLALIDDLVRNRGSQLIIATHSPILMAYPQATICLFDEQGIRPIAFRETEHYRLTRDFLNSPEAYLRHLFTSGGSAVSEDAAPE